MKILNLDEITSDDKTVVVGGDEYVIPGDLPVSTMLRLIDNSNKVQENPADVSAMQDGVDVLLDVFKIRKPDADVEKIKRCLTMAQYSKLMSYVFGGFDDGVKKSDGGQSPSPSTPSN